LLSISGKPRKQVMPYRFASLLTGILFGAFPTLRLSRSAPASALRGSSRNVAGGNAQQRLHNGLVVTQTSIGKVLLIGAGLLMRSFLHILSVDPVLDPKHLLTCRAGVPFNPVDHDLPYRFYEQLLERVSALPGAETASAGWPLPMSNNGATVCRV